MNNAVTYLWKQSLAVSNDELRVLKTLLSEDEIGRAERFVYEKDQRRFIVARGTLRKILGQALRQDPQTLNFTYNEHGKPSLMGLSHPPFFNVSHSNELAVYALCQDFPVGIDIEYVKYDIEAEEIATRFFADSEGESIRLLPDAEKIEAFFRCWTRKEALLKALGQGLSFQLRNCEVSLMPGEPAKVISIHGNRELAKEWSVYSFHPEPGYTGAVVVHGLVEKFEMTQ